MFDRTKLTIDTCKSVYSRWRQLGKKLIRNPFFPLLFIGEVVKTATITYAQTGAVVTPTTTFLLVLAIITTTIWVFAEQLLDEATETYNEIDEMTDDIIDERK